MSGLAQPLGLALIAVASVAVNIRVAVRDRRNVGRLAVAVIVAMPAALVALVAMSAYGGLPA